MLDRKKYASDDIIYIFASISRMSILFLFMILIFNSSDFSFAQTLYGKGLKWIGIICFCFYLCLEFFSIFLFIKRYKESEFPFLVFTQKNMHKEKRFYAIRSYDNLQTLGMVFCAIGLLVMPELFIKLPYLFIVLLFLALFSGFISLLLSHRIYKM